MDKLESKFNLSSSNGDMSPEIKEGSPQSSGEPNFIPGMTSQKENDLFQKLIQNQEAMENIKMFQEQLMVTKVGNLDRTPIWSREPCNLFFCKIWNQTWKDFNGCPGIKLFEKDPSEHQRRGPTFTKVGRVDFNKKVLVIFNPRSGRQTSDKKARIVNILEQNNVKHEFYETQRSNDIFYQCKNRDLEPYGAIVVVGGDGTVHEAFNGLFQRTDKKRVPIGVLPNGSGDDFVGALGLEVGDIDTAIKFILKGQTVKIDAVRVLLDYDSEQQLRDAANRDPSIKIDNHLRYSMVNSSLCLSANCARNAAPMKPYLGKHAYTIQTLLELVKRRHEIYDVEIDRSSYNQCDRSNTFLFPNEPKEEKSADTEKQELLSNQTKSTSAASLDNPNELVPLLKDFDTNIIYIYNGKSGGGRIMLSPMSMINDGLVECSMVKQRMSTYTALDLFNQVKKGGKHAYLDSTQAIRAKKIRLTNKRKNEDGSYLLQDVNIDGEDLIFEKTITYEVMPSTVELIVDFEWLVDKYCFKTHE